MDTDREAVLRRARRIELKSRRLVARALAGDARSVFRGTGIEFDSVREYSYGDDVRAIDWNVTARAGRPYVKRFVTTRERDLVLAVDRSPSMRFGSGDRSKQELAAELAAILTLVAARGRERVGLVEFGNRSPAGELPRRGRQMTDRIVAHLLAPPLPPDPLARSEDLVSRLERLLKRRSLVFVVSDFHDPPLARDLRRIAVRHEVIAVRVIDPREESLAGTSVVECLDPETGRRFTLDAVSRSERLAFAAAAARRRERARETLRSAGVAGFELSTLDDRFAPLFDFLEARRRGPR